MRGSDVLLGSGVVIAGLAWGAGACNVSTGNATSFEAPPTTTVGATQGPSDESGSTAASATTATEGETTGAAKLDTPDPSDPTVPNGEGCEFVDFLFGWGNSNFGARIVSFDEANDRGTEGRACRYVCCPLDAKYLHALVKASLGKASNGIRMIKRRTAWGLHTGDDRTAFQKVDQFCDGHEGIVTQREAPPFDGAVFAARGWGARSIGVLL